MPKKKIAPQIEDISPTDHKARERRIKRMVQLRLAYGKSAFFENRKPRYPIDEIAPALEKCESKAIKHGKHLDFSQSEIQLWLQMFKVLAIAFGFSLILSLDWDHDGDSDFLEALDHLVQPIFNQDGNDY